MRLNLSTSSHPASAPRLHRRRYDPESVRTFGVIAPFGSILIFIGDARPPGA